MKKIIVICVSILVVVSIPIGIFLSNHIILLKYLIGTARNLGTTIKAKVYTNGNFNENIQVFRAKSYWGGEKANYLILFGKKEPIDIEILGVNLDERNVFTTSSSNKNDYELIWGNLYQSEIGGLQTSLSDGAKGIGFDARLKIMDKSIVFLVPKHEYFKKYNADSIRIELQ